MIYGYQSNEEHARERRVIPGSVIAAIVMNEIFTPRMGKGLASGGRGACSTCTCTHAFTDLTSIEFTNGHLLSLALVSLCPPSVYTRLPGLLFSSS